MSDEPSNDPDLDLATLGETKVDGGFRRVTVPPQPLALAWLRELLLEAAADSSELSRAGLEGFEAWSFLATLVGTEWARGARRSSPAAVRVLRRRLRALGVRATSFEAAAAAPVGTPVHLQGVIKEATRPLHQSRATSHIWFHSEVNAHNVRLVVEEGCDFLMGDDTGRTACVMAMRGHLVNGARLVAGDRVSVFGMTDLVADAAARGERSARVLAVRAGDDGPLVVRLAHRAPDARAERIL
jgi:hypothetical protein